jgi:TolB protein
MTEEQRSWKKPRVIFSIIIALILVALAAGIVLAQAEPSTGGECDPCVCDLLPPELSCLQDVVLSCDEDLSPDGRAGWATAVDNCDPNPKVTYTDAIVWDGCERDCPQEFILLRTWVAQDASGNAIYMTQEIKVKDRTAPVIETCAEDLVVCADANLQAVVPDMRDQIVASDNCSEHLVVLQDPAPGTVVGVGVHTVTFTVVDQCGNASTCEADFVVRTGKIKAFKFKDNNLNGEWDEGEPGLAGWTLTVYNAQEQVVASGKTDAEGGISFEGLPCGTYTVVETQQPGWQATTPTAQQVVVTLESPGVATFGNSPVRQCPTCRNQIVFQSDRAGGNLNIFKMDLDGGNVVQLTTDPAADIAPAWSYDGNHIAFATERDGDWEVYWMWHDGREQTNVTKAPGSDEMAPNWNCDQLVYQSNVDGNWEIYKISPLVWKDVPVRLTQNAAEDVAPSWSPDGKLIAFQSDRNGDADIYLMRPDGTQVRRLTTSAAEERNPVWSATRPEVVDIADGGADFTEHSKWVVYESDEGHPGQFDIFRIHIDTGEVVQLTDDPSDDLDPAGMPYCDLIAFQSERGATGADVWKMSLAGENQTNITLGDSASAPWADGIDELPTPPPTPTPTATPTATPEPTPDIWTTLYLPLVVKIP